MALNVTVLYTLAPQLTEHLRSSVHNAGVNITFAAADHSLDDAALLARAAEADVLIGSRPTAQFLARCARAQLFQLPWAGVTPLLPALREGNALRAAAGLPPLQLANNHGVCPATAQHAVAMLLALSNQILPHDRWMRAGRWRVGDSEARSTLLRPGVTLGLLGYGAINRRVHELLAPFGMRCIALKRSWSRDLPSANAAALHMAYTTAQLHDFLRATDILVIAVPHTPETEGMLGEAELALLGGVKAEGAGNATSPLGGLPLLVNVARGAVIEEAALYAALANRALAAAALDVWYDYNPEPDAEGGRYPWRDRLSHPFQELPNVLLSPHRAASPLDDLQRWEPVIDNLLRMARGEPPHSLVDLQAGY